MNEVIVTRAPRLKFVKDILICGHFALTAVGGIILKLQLNGEWQIVEHGNPNNRLWEGTDLVLLGDLEETSKWVSNGRKLEDLQSDCKDEWIHAKEMQVGTMAVIITREFSEDDLIGTVVFRADESLLMAFAKPESRWTRLNLITAPFSVWPLGRGIP